MLDVHDLVDGPRMAALIPKIVYIVYVLNNVDVVIDVRRIEHVRSLTQDRNIVDGSMLPSVDRRQDRVHRARSK